MSARRTSGITGRPNFEKTDKAFFDEAMVLECKVAYLSVVKGASIDKMLTSKSDLLLALQNAGRNPTQKALFKYWSSSTDEMGFDEFCGICKKFPVTTADDLMKAFKKIDINGDGFISHLELKKVMTTKGEKMTDEEVAKLIDEVDENKDGKLDYKEFSNMILNTSKKCKETAVRRYEKGAGKDAETTGEGKTSGNAEVSKDRRGSMNGVFDDDRSRHRQRTSSIKDTGSSSVDGNESMRSVPRSPRMSPRVSPRGAPKGAKNREDLPHKDRFGSQNSLRSHDPRRDESPKPAPRRMSRQETTRQAISSLNLKLQTPKKLAEWKQIKRRGMFYVEDNGDISCSQYQLVIAKSSSVWLTISPSPSQSTAATSAPLDMAALIIRSKPDKNGNSLITFTERRDVTGTFGVRCDLEAGKYVLLTFTSGCSLPISKPSTDPQKKLVKKKATGSSDQLILTKEFKYVLTDIFNMVDTDTNGLLSRGEFNHYSMRTGEDEVGDDEWDVVKDNAELKRGELTCKGFIRLIELEAEDACGDTDDLWVALEALGYDSSLVQNQAYPFTIDVCLEVEAEHSVTALPSLMMTRSKAMQTVLKEAYINKGEPLSAEGRCRAAKSSGNDKDVRIYCYETDTVAAIVVDNKLPTRATLKLNCTGSKNVKANTKSLAEVFAVPANSCMVAYHLVPEDESKEWFVSCVEKELLTAA